MSNETPYTQVRVSQAHDSACQQVAGAALYIDDIPEPRGTLQVYVAQSPHAHARILQCELDDVAHQPGVAAVVTLEDIPGVVDVSCIHAGDEPVFAQGTVQFLGQPIYAVAAETLDAARLATQHARIEYEPLPAVLTVEQAMAQQSFVLPPRKIKRGDPDTALQGAKHRLQGSLRTGGQDHFYLESHISLAVPEDDGGMLIYCSTQNPSEVQSLCARVLDLPDAAVKVQVRRMGGAFGGKETQPAQLAIIAALVACKTGRPAKVRLDRDDDMRMTGKRHAFVIDYDIGFDDQGLIEGVRFVQKVRCGYTADLSGAVADRGVLHCDNSYYLANVAVESYRCRTNTVSDTAFRGFGIPQGVMGIERAMLDIAQHLGLDPLEVRRRNLYGPGRDQTHYGQTLSNMILPEIIDQLVEESRYDERRQAVQAFNQTHRYLKKGIALTPVMMGISFTRLHLNQGGAFINIYKDGSIALNHGGTEMGQGLFIKVAQIVAHELGVGVEKVRITATTTEKVPNTSATASSAGSDLNGMAARDAALKLKGRLSEVACRHFGAEAEAIVFQDGHVQAGEQRISFEKLVGLAYLERTSLSATGFFKTPDIHFDNDTFHGHPFLYFAYGAAVSEVLVDTLTGEYRVERVDILHDVGRSLNPAIDIGQIEGGFIQGMGWLTSEELHWDDKGRLRTHAPSTYKIPSVGNRPDVMNVKLMENPAFRSATPYHSKAVGEPPLMLAVSVYQALLEAASEVVPRPAMDAPITPERVLLAKPMAGAKQACAKGLGREEAATLL
ncbi:xanthine dehydrogenase molybdopterin binding subunit [Pusillimonas sp. CC-YST705]|uniref:Xanthine dehydrogenase molybdopterin binding subunit n=1 Tax=Mesopusillimonas faecipullorum TaxID=2755040 RepID=A0ABS8CAE7_9BURK|nr:xanthine dehydrogenase molybdopterin binding subunit [Mesopusillimonas faecipullorum]MCB5363012.1 xanthine dehydrogenase molybdopterin binding subunit [Mesopusillimonas faecipullorum]